MSNRLGNDNYNRPKKTLQEKLTKEEIAEKLIGYTEVKDLNELKEIPLGTELRYFVFIGLLIFVVLVLYLVNYMYF
jgi:hypothetical protein